MFHLDILIRDLAVLLVNQLHQMGAHHAHILGHFDKLVVVTKHLVIRFTVR